MKSFLHVGCGSNRKDMTTRGFNSPDWNEIRLDIDAKTQPDVLGTITNMSKVPSESVDAIYSSHNIEHLYPHEVPLAFSEFLRVLNPDGFLVITCPDLQSVCRLVAEDKLTETAYESPAGHITPIDIIYGHRQIVAMGNHYMSHKCGFTKKVLDGSLIKAGFKTVASMVRGYAPFFDLYAVSTKSNKTQEEVLEIAKLHFPII